jgi:hypothetical protein
VGSVLHATIDIANSPKIRDFAFMLKCLKC